MIIARIHGGLGNQLFQYAAGRRLAEKHKTALKLDISTLQQAETKRYFCLNFFKINAEIATAHEIDYVNRIDTSWKRRLLWNIAHTFHRTPLYFLREKTVAFEPRVLRAPNNTYLHGHWQSEKNFKDIETIIHNEFIVTSPQIGLSAEMAKQILSTNSVSIHIRRTDYVSTEASSKIYNVCGPEYYERAVKYISNKVVAPIFFIFSDDIPWTKKNINLPFPTVFVDINNDSTNYEDLRLMSQCKHNIIANSTFSWWGAWLNNNDKKIIIAPQQWFGVIDLDTSDIVPSSWIKL